jgi:hypothetical protein
MSAQAFKKSVLGENVFSISIIENAEHSQIMQATVTENKERNISKRG